MATTGVLLVVSMPETLVDSTLAAQQDATATNATPAASRSIAESRLGQAAQCGDSPDLPSTARELIAAIGLEATIKLCAAEGGNELHLPSVVAGKSLMWEHLVEIVGVEAATRLVDQFRTEHIYVPMCVHALKLERNRDVCRRIDAGEPFDQVRRRYRISRSYLYRLLKTVW